MNIITIMGIWRNDPRTMWRIGPLSNHSKWWDWYGMSLSNNIYIYRYKIAAQTHEVSASPL